MSIFEHFLAGLTPGDKEEDLLDELNKTLMRDRKQFSDNVDDESSIFIDPFYSTVEEAQR